MKEETKNVEAKETKAKKETKSKEVSFLSLLKDGKIKEGSKVGFTPEGSNKEKIIVVDSAFLKMELKDEEYYKKFKYNLK